ncbi:MAG: ribonuclease Y [Leptospirillia bacterium]
MGYGLCLFLAVAGAAAGLYSGYMIGTKRRSGAIFLEEKSLAEQRTRLEEQKQNSLKEAAIEAREEALRIRIQAEEEVARKKGVIHEAEQALRVREGELEQTARQISDAREKNERERQKIAAKEQALSARETELRGLEASEIRRLEEISSLTVEEARERLIQSAEASIRQDVGRLAQKLEQEVRDQSVRKARETMTLAIQRYANEHVAEISVSVVPIPSDDVKGRVIGREGRNIRSFQAATGVDLIIDDTPDAIIISGFDPLRREVARLALEQLLSDGRIHPARIEEIVEKVRRDLDVSLKEEAEKIAFELGITDIHPEILKLLGRLKFRTSYGQNNLLHAREVAYLCQMMAHDLGLDSRIAKRAGLLHDIGKSLSHEGEGSHPSLGGEAAKKYGEPSQVVNAIMSHHGDIEPSCLESVLVAAADAISAARPGARRESIDVYVKRLEKLETIATSFKGVEKAYAIQAGREIRIIVNQDQVTDADLQEISRGIAQKIEAELTYPGQIKVTVIRENRIVEYAR